MQSVDTLIGRMNYHIELWEKTSDRRHIFLSCYNMMSTNMYEAIKQGKFSDANWVSHLLIRFSEYYFEALDQYEHVSPETPKVWKQVYDNTVHSKLHVIQNLLIGVNAHINYDLPLALYDCLKNDWHNLDEITRYSRRNDHEVVNTIIGETIDAVQDDVIAPMSPAMALIDKLMGRVDEWFFSRLISGWRTDVWNVTQSLLQATSADMRELIRLQQEKKVLSISKNIIGII